jgi:cyclic pyranopterin phosphate synthase
LLRGSASDEELSETITRVWSARTDRYSELREAGTNWSNRSSDGGARKIEMYQIGG